MNLIWIVVSIHIFDGVPACVLITIRAVRPSSQAMRWLKAESLWEIFTRSTISTILLHIHTYVSGLHLSILYAHICLSTYPFRLQVNTGPLENRHKNERNCFIHPYWFSRRQFLWQITAHTLLTWNNNLCFIANIVVVLYMVVNHEWIRARMHCYYNISTLSWM